MEKIQERGLRFVYNDVNSTYSELLKKSGKKLLYIERIQKLAIFVYKCIKQEGPSSTHDLYSIKNVPYSFRDSSRAIQDKVTTTTYGLNSLRYSGSVVWNNLPLEIKESIDFHMFKKLIKTWDGPSCKCGFCVMCKNLN